MVARTEAFCVSVQSGGKDGAFCVWMCIVVAKTEESCTDAHSGGKDARLVSVDAVIVEESGARAHTTSVPSGRSNDLPFFYCCRKSALDEGLTCPRRIRSSHDVYIYW